MSGGPEDLFMDKVVDTAHIFGWRAAHWRPMFDRGRKRYSTGAQYDAPGFPDLIMFHPSGDVCAAELKTWERRNEFPDEQRAWIDLMNRGPVDAHLWTDRDFDRLVVPRLSHRRG